LAKSAVAGFREWGDDTLAATFVEEERLSWSSTVSCVFPELAASFDPAAKGITLTQLLSRRAGLEPNIDYGSLAALGSIRDQRLGAARKGLAKNPSSEPGTRFEYSNLGYAIAGAMIERAGDGD
jgi:CubicO group peptidase (beta-lactamase class C family)